jgi:uncharacterized protein YjbI with pentapeptide repeats
LAAAAVGALALCIFVIPSWIYSPLPNSAFPTTSTIAADKRIELETARLQLQNGARTTLLQGYGGLVLLIGSVIAWRQLQIGHSQLQQNTNATQDQLSLSHLGQIAERFTRAIDQLGNNQNQVEVVLGGIYALGHIARDSEYDRASISEILAAYIRHHAPWPVTTPANQDLKETSVDNVPSLERRAPDIQAALKVLGGHGLATAAEDLGGLNLMNADLRGANLYRAGLKMALFMETNLAGSHAIEADLEKAWFAGANLEGVNFSHARLSGAVFYKANLDEATFQGANLARTQLSGTDLRGARRLDEASLFGAISNEATQFPDGFDAKAHGVLSLEELNARRASLDLDWLLGGTSVEGIEEAR